MYEITSIQFYKYYELNELVFFRLTKLKMNSIPKNEIFFISLRTALSVINDYL